MAESYVSEWRPNGRPKSTAAQNFSSDLDHLFRMHDGIDTLHSTVDQKKQAVTSRNQELLAIESKIKETEERLRKANKEVTRSSSTAEGSERPRDTTKLSEKKQEAFKSSNSKGVSDLQPKNSRSPNTRRSN